MGLPPGRVLGQQVETPAHQMTEGVAAQGVAAQQDHVDGEDQSADADPESGLPGGRILEPHGLPGVVGEDHDEDEGEVQEVAVHVLQDQRERALAAVALARLAHRAGRRVGPERLVVGAAVVVAGQAEAARRPQDQERGRPRQPAEPPRWLGPEPGMVGVTEELGRVERRKVVAVGVVLALESSPGGVDDEGGEAQKYGDRLKPPGVRTHRSPEAPPIREHGKGRRSSRHVPPSCQTLGGGRLGPGRARPGSAPGGCAGDPASGPPRKRSPWKNTGGQGSGPMPPRLYRVRGPSYFVPPARAGPGERARRASVRGRHHHDELDGRLHNAAPQARAVERNEAGGE